MVSDTLGRTVVGPAPWYWETFPTFGERYEWRFLARSGSSYPDGEPVLHRLMTGSDPLPVLRVRVYGRVLRPKEGHVLLWGPQGRRGQLIIETYSVDSLASIGEARPGNDDTPWAVSAEVLDRVAIPEGLPAGRAPGRYVARVAFALPEILLLADGPSAEDAATSIYAWHPGEGTVDVMPQTWLRQDTHDLGYQWITRVTRHGRSRHILGDGIRLAPFELNAEGTSMRRMPLWRQGIAALRHQR